jgi:small ligand-binding sensory domain FIST
VEYFDEPALAVMLLDIPSDQYRVFSGVAPLSMGFEAHTALVHADGNTVELSELVEDMARRTDSGYLFGGISSSRGPQVQFAVSGDGTIRGQGSVSGVFSGGLSGVAFGAQLGLVSRVTQGCKPLSTGMHTVTDAEGNVVYGLNGQPALDVMLAELAVTLQNPKMAMEAVRATLVGLGTQKVQSLRRGNFGDQVRVRHIIGLDPGRRGIAVAEHMQGGMQLAFCQRNVQAAKADLKRICAEIREELEPEEFSLALAGAQGSFAADAAQLGSRGIAGAIYVSCSGRGGAHFGGPSAELQMVRAALGDVPLVGFFAGGEIAYDQLYGYTGVLTVFPMQ